MVCTLDWPNYSHNKLVQKGNGQSATLPPTSSCPAPIFQIVIQYLTLLFFLLRLKFYNDAIIKLGRAVRLWNGTSLCSQKWRKGAIFLNQIKIACKTNAEHACRWGFKLFIWEMGLHKYKSTLIDKGLNYFIDKLNF